MNALSDNDPMPFGQYRGDAMEKVPAKYFHYLHTTGIHDDRRADRQSVSAYIKANLSALQMEYKNGIW